MHQDATYVEERPLGRFQHQDARYWVQDLLLLLGGSSGRLHVVGGRVDDVPVGRGEMASSQVRGRRMQQM